jgi:Ca2+-binding RTX toxin-like protein
VVAAGETATTSSYLYDVESSRGNFNAGAWHDVPAECGPPEDYLQIIIYGKDGPDVLPIDGEHPPPGDDGDQPEPQPGNKGHVILGYGGDDVIYGGNAKDCLIGGAGNDTIYGNNGADIIIGGPGDDQLWGDNGPDELDGGDDDDVLIGGKGADALNGQAGNDECYGRTTDGDSKGGGNSEIDTLTLCESGTPSDETKLLSSGPDELEEPVPMQENETATEGSVVQESSSEEIPAADVQDPDVAATEADQIEETTTDPHPE